MTEDFWTCDICEFEDSDEPERPQKCNSCEAMICSLCWEGHQAEPHQQLPMEVE